MKPVGTSVTAVHTAAILSEARLESGIVETPLSSPVDEVSGSRDSYETADARADRPSNSELDAASANEANPFDGLERGDADDVRLSNRTIGTDVALDTTHAQLARLNAALLAMARNGKEIPSHLIEAFLLLVHDAQANEHPLSAAQQERLSRYAGKLATNDATDADHKQFWGQCQITEDNVMAYVQRVLRESYLIGNGLLYDMAMQLQKTNELRKKVRDELARARTTQASWAGQAKGDAKWTSNAPYSAMTVNEDAGRLDPDLMDEDELRQHQAELDAEATGPGQADMSSAIAALDADSKLTNKQRFQLNVLKGGNDETVKHSMNDLLAAIPSMNAADLKEYLEPALNHLTSGNTDEDEIFQIFRTLNPAQMLQVVADGYTQEKKFKFKGEDAQNFRDLTASTLFDYLSQSTSTQNPTFMQKLGAGAKGAALGALAGYAIASPVGAWIGAIKGGLFSGFSDPTANLNQLSSNDARGILEQLKSASTSGPDTPDLKTASDGTKVGDQRTINTTAGMDAYIQGLEDKLNSMGDDAQLMQVDMQNALQKSQQLIQMMSNLLKVIHDTAMAEIRNANS